MCSASPPVAIARVVLAELGAHRSTMPSTCAGEAVDHAGADRVDGRLADQRARLLEVDLRQLGARSVSASMRDLDARAR